LSSELRKHPEIAVLIPSTAMIASVRFIGISSLKRWD